MKLGWLYIGLCLIQSVKVKGTVLNLGLKKPCGFFSLKTSSAPDSAFNPSTCRQIAECEASLVYRKSFRTARATQRNSVSKNLKKPKKKKKKKPKQQQQQQNLICLPGWGEATGNKRLSGAKTAVPSCQGRPQNWESSGTRAKANPQLMWLTADAGRSLAKSRRKEHQPGPLETAN
jgi:hypothetical protein